MTKLLPFVEVSPARISEALTSSYAALMTARPKVSVRRARSANLLILAASTSELTEISKVTETFSAVRPGRLFLIGFDEAATEVKAAISIAVHDRGPGDILASDIIRLTMPESKIGAIGSVVRAHLLSGVSTDIWLSNTERALLLLEALAPMADSLILDSTDCEPRFGVLSELHSFVPPILDLSWIALAQWREQARAIFQKPIVRARLHALRKVSITAVSKNRFTAAQLLLAGWIAERLHLKFSACSHQSVRGTAEGFGRPVAECEFTFKAVPLSEDTSPLTLQLGGRSRLAELSFEFTKPEGTSGIDRVSIVCSGESLTTSVETTPSYKISRPKDDQTQVGLIQRYYSIGDSIVNYPGALSRALELYALMHQADLKQANQSG